MFVLIRAERLECAQAFGFASQHEVAYGSAAETLCPRGDHRAGTDTGAQFFVGSLQPCRHVDRIAIGRVGEEAAPAEIADNSRSRMHTNSGDAERDALFVPAIARSLCVLVQ